MRGVSESYPKKAVERSIITMLTAFLLTSSLLLMLAMCASLMWLASARVAEAAEAAQDPDA